MPEKATVERARKDKRQGKAPSTQAGEFVREEIHHVREGKHGARSAKQAIAIGLSKARRAGVKLPSPPKSASPEAKRSAESANRAAALHTKPSKARSRASSPDRDSNTGSNRLEYAPSSMTRVMTCRAMDRAVGELIPTVRRE